jgi:hypothetical protein
MIIGDLTRLSGTYTYYHRGTNEFFFPDLIPDRGGLSGFIPFAKGGLFRAEPVGWKGGSLYDVGLDLFIALKTACFIDRAVIAQDTASSSAFAGVAALVSCDGKTFRAAGRLDPGVRGIIEDESVVVPIGVTARVLVMRFASCFRNIVFKQMAIFGRELDAPVVYPIPAKIEYPRRRGTPPPVRISGIVTGENPSEDTTFAARLLAEKIAEDFGAHIPILKEAEMKNASGMLILGKTGEIKALAKLSGVRPEGYALHADQKTVRLSAADRRGLIYGVETLLALLRASGGLRRVPACTIDDYPASEFRGVHLGLPRRQDIPFVKRLIRYLLAPMRMNTIFLEFTAGMRFDRHPEINQAWLRANRKAARGQWPPVPHGDMVTSDDCLTKDEVCDLIAYASSYGFEVIPEVQSLSHVQYLTMTYPEIAEKEPERAAAGAVDIEKEDKKPPEFYPHCYCPSHEKSYEVIFDLIDEIVDVVKPARYVHMGHDEVYVIGVCDRCRNRTPADLFALHVNRVYAHLKKKALGMMIWSDMLQPVTAYRTPPAIDSIPKDIVLLDFIWYFHIDKDIEDNLLGRGFKVIMGNMYSSHYPRYEIRRSKKGILGAEVSTWARADESTLARLGKLYDFVYSANMIWSNAYRENLRFTYDDIIAAILPRIRSRLHGESFPSQAARRTFTPLKFGVTHAGALALAPGRSAFHGVPFIRGSALTVEGPSVRDRRHPSQARIPLRRKFDSLIFLHAAGANAQLTRSDRMPLGAYFIEYAGGRKIKAPIEYGVNISAVNRRHAQPMTHNMYRHAGYIATYIADPFVQEKTDDGRDITLYGYEWINPRKDETIKAIWLAAEGTTDAAVTLFGLTGVRQKPKPAITGSKTS